MSDLTVIDILMKSGKTLKMKYSSGLGYIRGRSFGFNILIKDSVLYKAITRDPSSFSDLTGRGGDYLDFVMKERSTIVVQGETFAEIGTLEEYPLHKRPGMFDEFSIIDL
jgi:hypothetical protein